MPARNADRPALVQLCSVVLGVRSAPASHGSFRTTPLFQWTVNAVVSVASVADCPTETVYRPVRVRQVFELVSQIDSGRLVLSGSMVSTTRSDSPGSTVTRVKLT